MHNSVTFVDNNRLYNVVGIITVMGRFAVCRLQVAQQVMPVSRVDLLAAAEDDCKDTFLGLIAKHVSTC